MGSYSIRGSINNPTTNKIYVPNPDSNTVTVIDSNVTNIRVGISPTAIAINAASNKTRSLILSLYLTHLMIKR